MEAPASSRRRVTEEANALTAQLDAAAPLGLVRLLGACDAQIFAGFGGLPGLYDESCVLAAARAARAVARALRHPRGRVLIGGCGTSGRLAHLLARDFNAADAAAAAAPAEAGARSSSLAPRRFGHLLAGGDGALLVPQEAVEDEPDAGRRDLARWLRDDREASGSGGGGGGDDDSDAPVVVIGVSCGLSATYVGSLLQAALDGGPRFCAVAVGFNPAEAVADVRVPGWSGSFRDVLRLIDAAAAQGRGAVVNPVVGPEAVAGSSRMKGGSATSVLLSSVLQLGVRLAAAGPGPDADADGAFDEAAAAAQLRGAFLQFEGAVRTLYACEAPALADVVAAAAASLGAAEGAEAEAAGPGRVYYLGAGHAGLMGLVDASESTDTYGARFDDVRGVMAGGWGAMAVGAAAAAQFEAEGGVAVPPELLLGAGAGGGLSRASASGAGAVDEGAAPVRADPSLAFFERSCVRALGACDTVILLHLGEGPRGGPGRALRAELLRAAAAAAARGAVVRHIIVGEAAGEGGDEAEGGGGGGYDEVGVAEAAAVAAGSRGGVALRLARLSLRLDGAAALPPLPRARAQASLGAAPAGAPSGLGHITLKLALNAVTTGAFTARGCVVGNRMVNMMLTNQKLFLRAVGIASDVAGVSAAAARRALLRAAYGADDISAIEAEEAADARAIERHVARASVVEKCIPTALLLCLLERERGVGGAAATVAEARAALARQPNVRRALRALGAGGAEAP